MGATRTVPARRGYGPATAIGARRSSVWTRPADLLPLYVGLLDVVVVVLAASLLVRRLHAPPIADELYHVLAARTYLTSGVFGVGEGVYLRGWPISWSVAQLFGLFGDHLAAARLVGTIPIVALVALGAIWLGQRLGRGMAAVWLGLVALSPIMIDVAAYVRWYGLTTFLACLVFAGLIVAVPAGVSASRRLGGVAAAWLGVVGIAFLQVEFLAPILLVAAMLVVGLALETWPLRRAHHLIVALGAAAIGVAVVVQAQIGLDHLWSMYRAAPLWAADHVDSTGYYSAKLLNLYPILWPLTLILWLVGRRRDWVLVDAAMLIAVVALAFHSGAAMKAPRYIAYVFPWLALVWGAGLVNISRWLLERWRIAGWRDLVKPALLGTCLMLLLLPGPTVGKALALIGGGQGPAMTVASAATASDPGLRQLVAASDIVITTSVNDTLYGLGRADYLINQSSYEELNGRTFFARQVQVQDAASIIVDRRTGVRVLRDAGVLQAVLGCVRTAVILSERQRWEDDKYVPADMRQTVETGVTEAPPAAGGLRVWQWHNPEPTQDCGAG